MKRVCIIGLGYIGLPTAILLTESGFDVTGFDINLNKVNAINKCDPTIQEPEILPRLEKAIKNKLLKATENIESADYFIIAVPTPITKDKKADLNYVWSAGQSLCKVIKQGDTVILESTCSIGTTEKLAKLIEENTGLKAETDFFIGYCPERVLPGNIFYELVYNNRVIGGVGALSNQKIHAFYSQFTKGNLFLTNSKTAETVKLVENSFRDVSIAFAHQIASMAQEIDIDPYEVIEIANKHPRVNILTPTCGVGGHCIAVDPWFLIESFPESTKLLKEARKTNDHRPYQIVELIKNSIKEREQKANISLNISILGITYKPNIDDLRESPALEIANLLLDAGYNISVVEPNVLIDNIPSNLAARIINLDQAIDQADIIVLLVAHNEFKELNLNLVGNKKLLNFSGLDLNNKQKLEAFSNETNISKKWNSDNSRIL